MRHVRLIELATSCSQVDVHHQFAYVVLLQWRTFQAAAVGRLPTARTFCNYRLAFATLHDFARDTPMRARQHQQPTRDARTMLKPMEHSITNRIRGIYAYQSSASVRGA